MNLRQRKVMVSQFPQVVDTRQRKAFLREFDSSINVERPLFVFDCSIVRVMDHDAIYFLLCCLEEVMKRNGDIRLAALSQNARTRLAAVGVDRIFDVFNTIADAVDSYGQPRLDREVHKSTFEMPVPASENGVNPWSSLCEISNLSSK